MKNFTQIPNILLELSEKKEIDAMSISVYFAIFSHKNQKNKRCFPSIRTIARKLNVDVKTVIKHRDKLCKCGIISYTNIKGVGINYHTVGNIPTDCWNNSNITIRNNNTNNKALKKLKKELLNKRIVNK